MKTPKKSAKNKPEGRLIRFFRSVGDRLERSTSTMAAITVAMAVLLVIVGFACFSIAILPDRSGIIRVEVPSFTGGVFDDLSTDERLFDISVEYKLDNELPEGTIMSQNPSAGAHRMVKKGERLCRVELVVSRRGSIIILPDLIGKTAEEAEARLSELGLSAEILERNSNSEIGRVVSTYPRALSDIPEGSRVKIWVSVGVERRLVSVPELSGLSENEAAERLRAAGLEVGQTEYIVSDRPIGIVISQSAPFGAELSVGSVVYLTVSLGKK